MNDLPDDWPMEACCAVLHVHVGVEFTSEVLEDLNVLGQQHEAVQLRTNRPAHIVASPRTPIWHAHGRAGMLCCLLSHSLLPHLGDAVLRS